MNAPTNFSSRSYSLFESTISLSTSRREQVAHRAQRADRGRCRAAPAPAAVSFFLRIEFHSLMRNSMSARSSFSLTPSATVRTMKPAPSGRIESMISRSRLRSLSVPMRREMPTWSTVGMKTRLRPGSET